MIFVTVGHELKFDRLMQSMDRWASKNPETEIFGQTAIGSEGGYVPTSFPSKAFVGPDEFSERIENATLIVSHAGMGTIITAQTMAKPIVVFPRRGDLKETRNNHQIATVERFADRDGIYAARDEAALFSTIEEALRDADRVANPLSAHAEPALIKAIRDFIHQ